MPLATLTDLDLQAARTLLADTELVGVVPAPELLGAAARPAGDHVPAGP